MTTMVVTGATGFVGRYLCALLTREGHHVVSLSRDADRARTTLGANAAAFFPWRDESGWRNVVADADAVFHLAGEAVADKRWTPEVKAKILSSRVETTRKIAETGPRVLISASAIGYYGDTGETPASETSPPGSDFLADVCKAWEAEAVRAADQHGSRVVRARIGIVLGRDGGPLQAMLHPPGAPFSPWKLGLGGPLGSGKQWVSWVHVEDVARMLLWAAQNPDISGAVNVVAPHAVRNRELTTAIGHAFHRPSALAVPAFALRLLMGDFTEILLYSQRVVPTAAQAAGYEFRFPEIQGALNDLLRAM